MNVLFLTNSLIVGGIEKNLVLLSHELVRRGHAVTVASRGGPLVAELDSAGVRHVPLKLTLAPRAVRADVGALNQLLNSAADDELAVVHIFSATTAAFCRIARLLPPKSTRPRVVTSVMGLKNDPDEHRVRTLVRAFVTNLGADRVIVTSPAIGKTINALPVRRSKQVTMSVQAVRLACDAQFRPPDRSAVLEELGVGPGELVVSTIGRLDSTKSHQLFIRAAARVCERRADVRFFIIGEGRERQNLVAEIARARVGDRLALLGERLDVDRLLGATDVYVRPGIVEGFAGMTVLEAQVAAVPVVAFSTEDVKLAIEHGVTGWLVPQGDVEALSDAVLELLDDSALAQRIGAAGRAHVEEHFGVESVVDRLVRLYKVMPRGRTRIPTLPGLVRRFGRNRSQRVAAPFPDAQAPATERDARGEGPSRAQARP